MRFRAIYIPLIALIVKIKGIAKILDETGRLLGFVLDGKEEQLKCRIKEKGDAPPCRPLFPHPFPPRSNPFEVADFILGGKKGTRRIGATASVPPPPATRAVSRRASGSAPPRR